MRFPIPLATGYNSRVSSPILTVRRCGLVDYAEARRRQEDLRDQLLAGEGDPTLLLLQHPPTVTAGSLTEASELFYEETEYLARGISLVRTNRGGRATYHGPGQLVGYPILDLAAAPSVCTAGSPSLRLYLRTLEEFLILLLAELGVKAARWEGAAGAWVGDRKIASVGVAVRRWVTTHGFAINVDMDLAPFGMIRPCGFDAAVMTSAAREGGAIPEWSDLEEMAGAVFARTFGLRLKDDARGA